MAAREHRSIHGIQQTKKMVPLITCETPLANLSAIWFLVSTYLISIAESNLILSNHQSSATLWVLDTCLIVGLVPFQKCTAETRFENVCGNVFHMRQLLNISVFLLFGFVCFATSFLSRICFQMLVGVLVLFSNATLLSPHPTNREQVIIRSPASNERNYDSVEL